MSIASLLTTAARTFADRPALSFGTRPHATYGAFAARVAALAGALETRFGLAPGDRVALAMKNCPQYLEVMFAAWHAGLCTVPINAKLHPREFAYILDNSGARLCFATADLAHALAALTGEVESLEQVLCVEDGEYERLAAHDPIPQREADDEAPAWLFYTSGTTGRPKGATLTHRTLMGMSLRYYADIDHLTEADCMLHAAPLSHGGGLYALPHIAKASHQVIPESQGFAPDEIIALMDVYDSLTFFAAPTMLNRLVAAPALSGARLEAIRTIFYGGAPMYAQDIKRALAALGPRLLGAYGQGEMPNTITALPKRMHIDTGEGDYEARLNSVGYPRTGVEVRLIDPDGQPVAPGEVGEVIARSDMAMTGYWRNPAATAESLRDGWLHTGDLGTLSAEGYLTLKDRSKDLIISGGSNIYPREVEEVLLRHPGVAEVSVIGRPHPDWGEEVIAFVAPRAGATVAPAELDAICLDTIARFKRPKEYLFLDEMPKSNYGKILKTALRERLAKGD